MPGKTRQNSMVSYTVSILAPRRRKVLIPIKIGTLGTSSAYTLQGQWTDSQFSEAGTLRTQLDEPEHCQT